MQCRTWPFWDDMLAQGPRNGRTRVVRQSCTIGGANGKLNGPLVLFESRHLGR
jgi:hypothetical protein